MSTLPFELAHRHLRDQSIIDLTVLIRRAGRMPMPANFAIRLDDDPAGERCTLSRGERRTLWNMGLRTVLPALMGDAPALGTPRPDDVATWQPNAETFTGSALLSASGLDEEAAWRIHWAVCFIEAHSAQVMTMVYEALGGEPTLGEQ